MLVARHDHESVQVMSADLELKALRSFTLIAGGYSFEQVATIIGRSQSAVSMQMQRLEADIGVPLFRRSRGVRLTAAGMRLLDHARRLVQANDGALRQMRSGDTCEIVLGVTPDFAETVLPEVVDRFQRLHPARELSLHVDATDQLVEAVERGRIDLAIALDRDHPTRRARLATASMVWLGGPGFETPRGGVLPLALFERPCAFRAAALKALGRSIPHRIRATSSSLCGIVSALRTGMYITARTTHLLNLRLEDVGQRLGLPQLPTVAFCHYAQEEAADPVRDDLVRICCDCLSEDPQQARPHAGNAPQLVHATD